jgi:hypothetical protein
MVFCSRTFDSILLVFNHIFVIHICALLSVARATPDGAQAKLRPPPP